MALTTRQILVRAYRGDNITPIGNEPTDAELTEGLGVYQSFIASLFGNDVGELLDPWEAPPAPTSQYPSRFPLFPSPNAQQLQQQTNLYNNPPPNVRLITNAGIGSPIYFPPTPPNGARMALVNVGLDYVAHPLTLSGNGRLIEGVQELILAANPTAPKLWFYRDDLANWVLVTDLTLDSDSPFPSQFDDFLVASMAIWITGSNGIDPPADIVARAKRGHTLLKTTYLQTNPGAAFPDVWRMQTYQSYGNAGWWGGPGFF